MNTRAVSDRASQADRDGAGGRRRRGSWTRDRRHPAAADCPSRPDAPALRVDDLPLVVVVDLVRRTTTVRSIARSATPRACRPLAAAARVVAQNPRWSVRELRRAP